MKKLSIGLACFPLFFFGVAIFHAEASTSVPGGTIDVDTTWAKADSPYIINGNVEVSPGVTLTVEPGTVIKFGRETYDYGDFISYSDYYLWVMGRLTAEGTENDKIYFEPLEEDGDSSGPAIYIDSTEEAFVSHAVFSHINYLGFNDSANVSLNNIEIRNSGGLNFYNVDSAMIQNSLFSNFLYDGIYSDSTNLSINNSTIDGARYSALYSTDGNLEMSDSKIKNVTDGQALSADNRNVTITNSIFENGPGSAGLSFSKASVTIASSSISGFDYGGIYVSGGSLRADRINVTDNSFVGILLEDASGGPGPMLMSLSSGDLEAPDDSQLQSASISRSRIINNDLFGLENDSNITVDAKNNWWGDLSGPSNFDTNPSGLGDEVVGNVDFTPWLTSDPWTESQQDCCSSVLFLPGFMASDLYVQGELFENQLWPPNSLLKTDVEKLMLDSDGNPVTQGIYTKEVVGEAFGFNVYKSFIQKMNDFVSQGKLSEWLPFPYDWRRDIDRIVNESTLVKVGNDFENKKLIDEAVALAQRSPTGKITIIGHSNGGLVGRALIKELQNQGKADIVDQFVMVAVPQIGTPKAIAGLLHGDQQALMFGLLLDKETARKFGYNMQSAYNLLPSQKYFDAISDPVIKFNDSISQVFNYSANNLPQSISSYSEMFDFLTLDNRGTTLGDSINVPGVLRSDLVAVANSNIENLTNWQIPSNVKVHEVAGWGEKTIKGVEYKSKQENMCLNQDGLYICQPQSVWDRKLLMTDDGDGTVVIPSAVNYNTPDEYYLNLFDLNNGFGFNLKHHNILEAQSVLDLVSEIVKKDADVNSLPNYISTQKPISTNQNLQLSVHSPVSLGVTDSQGRYTGLSSTPTTDAFTFVKEEIPNSYYLEIGDDKYVGLTNGSNYTVTLQGEGIGTFTFNQEIIQGDQVIDSENFIDIPVTPATKVSLTVNSGDLAETINIDTDGNGTVDAQVQASDQFDPVAYLTVIKSVIKTFDLKKSQENNLVKKIDNLIKLIQKGKIQKASAKSEIYVKKLNTKLQKIDGKPRKGKRITQEEIQIIIQSLEEFIDNLK